MPDDEKDSAARPVAPQRQPPRVGPRSSDRRYFAPATERNTAPILEVLKDFLPASGTVLEIGSGTGQHIAAFAREYPALEWQPSEPSPGGRDSVSAWVKRAGVRNVAAALDLETTRSRWYEALGARRFAAMLCINMIHIAPWRATEGLLEGAEALLESGGFLYLYGPFTRGGAHTAESNAAFDARLREENPSWGVRDIDEVAGAARRRGLALEATVEMPVNNLSLIFRKRDGAHDERQVPVS